MPELDPTRIQDAPLRFARSLKSLRHPVGRSERGCAAARGPPWAGIRPESGPALGTARREHKVTKLYSIDMSESTPSDGRYAELRRLGEEERQMTVELLQTRTQIASLIQQFLPPHARTEKIDEVVQASGYSRTLIDALRYKDHSWHQDSRPKKV